ncbi:hypothetical protein M3J09_002608 [Ascochyta lentis]
MRISLYRGGFRYTAISILLSKSYDYTRSIFCHNHIFRHNDYCIRCAFQNISHTTSAPVIGSPLSNTWLAVAKAVSRLRMLGLQ